ncbi:MAG TPA: hypothetical protein PK357_00165 [Candidatus Pacearchaeota archaeon]|nr:hypothetical protein [Candidatus Pacearchaeota archaeon]
MKNKKAQEMSTGAIALIILAVIVLVVLVLGFSMGWDKIIPWLKSNNIESVRTACSIACTTGGTYDFCSAQRDIKDGTLDKYKSTCNQLVTSHPEYGIELCPSITCPSS